MTEDYGCVMLSDEDSEDDAHTHPHRQPTELQVGGWVTYFTPYNITHANTCDTHPYTHTEKGNGRS